MTCVTIVPCAHVKQTEIPVFSYRERNSAMRAQGTLVTELLEGSFAQ